MRVLPPKSYGITVLVVCVKGTSGRNKSPQEAAISVCFINPTKQFNSFVQGSSTSLINKSLDIIFSASFEKPEMSSLLKEIILPVRDE